MCIRRNLSHGKVRCWGDQSNKLRSRSSDYQHWPRWRPALRRYKSDKRTAPWKVTQPSSKFRLSNIFPGNTQLKRQNHESLCAIREWESFLFFTNCTFSTQKADLKTLKGLLSAEPRPQTQSHSSRLNNKIVINSSNKVSMNSFCFRSSSGNTLSKTFSHRIERIYRSWQRNLEIPKIN